MKALRREERTVKEHGGAFFLGSGAPLDCFASGNWTISLQELPWPQCGFHIQAIHDETGAIVPADGKPRYATTLGAARIMAGQLATTLQGRLHDYSWKDAGCAPTCTVCARHAQYANESTKDAR